MSDTLNRPGVDASQVPVLEIGSLEEREALYGLPSQSVDNLWEGSKWGQNLGEGVVLSTSFSVEGVSVFTYADGFELPGLMAFNDTQVEAAWWAMNTWAAVSQISFVEVVDTGEAAGDIRWSQTSSPEVKTAHAYYPSDGPQGGDVWFGVGHPQFTAPFLGGYGWFTYLHELGHALGLKHPHEGNVPPVEGEDQLKYSVMSYSDTDWLPWWQSGGYRSTSFPTTPMLNDIAAIQWLYGANMEHATGDDVYRWEADAVVFETIWDAGGEDTLDASNQAQGVVLNLNAGRWSSIGSGYSVLDVLIRDTLTIAYGVVIEHAVGSAFDDVLVGNAVGNRLDGGEGFDIADHAEASAGVHVDLSLGLALDDGHGMQDTLVSIEGVVGSAFDDTLVGDAGDNRLDGLAGADWLEGGEGSDTIHFGRDHVTTNTGVHVDLSQGLVLDDGNGFVDTLVSIENAEGTMFNDLLVGDAHGNGLFAGNGQDTLDGGAGDDWLDGGDENDDLSGGVGNDVVEGGEGNDTILAGSGWDRYDGGAGVDLVDYRTASTAVWADLVRGLTVGDDGTDVLLGIEYIVGSMFSDWIVGDQGGNLLGGEAGDDTVVGHDGDDTLEGGLGHDLLDGAAGVDWASYWAAASGVAVDLADGLAWDDGDGGQDSLLGIERVYGSEHADTLTGDAHDNVLHGNAGADLLDGRAGNDTLIGGAGNDTLIGGVGFDLAEYATAAAGVVVDLAQGVALDDGEGGQDTLVGVEHLMGSAHNDHLQGDAGANWLHGGGGDNTLVGSEGDDTLVAGSGRDWLDGGEGSDMLAFDLSADATGVQVDLASGLVWMTGAEGTQSTLVGIESATGSAGHDVVRGDAGENLLFGREGDDLLDGRDAGDHVFGDLGRDTLIGGAGNDWLGGGDDVDMASYAQASSGVRVDLATGLAQNDGDGGRDTLVSIENVQGSAFNDLLEGDNGANLLQGLDGNDTLRGADGDDTLAGGAGNDVLNGGAGMDIASYVDASAAVVVELWKGAASQDGMGGADTLVWIEGVEGSDHNDRLVGDARDNMLWGGKGDDTLRGGAGQDRLDGGVGNDLLEGGDGNDRLQGGLGRNTLMGGEGDDVLDGDGGINLMDGGDGFDTADYSEALGPVVVDLWLEVGSVAAQGRADTLVSIEHVIGSAYNDSLTGGWGSLLEGRSGNDTLQAEDGPSTLLGGEGDDLIEGGVDNDTLDGGQGGDRLFGGKGNDTLTGGEGDDLLDGGEHELYVGDWVSYVGSVSGVHVDLAQGQALQDGHGGVDTLVGIEHLMGGAFDDLLLADDGDNTLVGGAGYDTLDGRGGSDWVDFQDAERAVRAELWRERALEDGHGASDTLLGFESVRGGRLDDLLAGTTGSNMLSGQDGHDTLFGGGGDDSLYGDAGHDLLWGGAGNDFLSGGEGNDDLNGGEGDDTLYAGVGDDKFVGGSGRDLVSYQEASQGVVAELWRGLASEDGQGGRDTLMGVEELNGSGFDDLLAGDAGDNRLYGSKGQDTLYGGHGRDWLHGAEGDDVIDAGWGDDTLLGGEGNDWLHGGEGRDLVDCSEAAAGVTVKLWKGRIENDGGGGVDTLVGIEDVMGSRHDDFIAGNQHANALHGGEGHDTLRGGSGDDTLHGGEGDDLLHGGTGSNVLDGGAGNDTLYLHDGINWVAVWTGGGQDTVHGFAATKGDVLALGFDLNGSGITTAEQALAAAQQVGADVVVDVGAGHQVTLVGVQLADLGADAFVVV